jgi:iron complex outermembrane receptor protein
MKRLVWCLGMALTPMGFVGQSAWAGDTGAENDQPTILVTGLREASASITGSHVPPLRYPQSVTVMNAQMLEKLGATRLDNALDLAGGVARQNDFGGLWDKYSVRGFAGDENSGPDILVNRFSSNFGYNAPIDTATVERFEFLKGAPPPSPAGASRVDRSTSSPRRHRRKPKRKPRSAMEAGTIGA